MLKIENLKAGSEGKEILRGVNLEIREGEIHAVIGPNGSGKSTLAYVIAGHPKYEITGNGKMWFEGKNLNQMLPEERANLGVFLANQYPVAISGLTVNSFLWQIYKKKNKNGGSVVEFRKWLKKQAEGLDLNLELLGRSINEGFSGGEKKKIEILQLLVSNPKVIILDEIDSGLDVDALKKIAKTIDKVVREKKISVLIITHYSRILRYLKVDKVLLMKQGKIVESGGEEIIDRVEKIGYGLKEN